MNPSSLRSSYRYYSHTEVTRRLGISGKALRVYEAKGLVHPERTLAGWRVYGPSQITRLQQVIALKDFGLSLNRIGQLLSGRCADITVFLSLQEEMLRHRKAEIERALDLLAEAQRKLEREGGLSPDDLIDLTRKTAMTHASDLNAAYERIAEKYLSLAERNTLKANGFAGMGSPDPAWDALTEEAHQLMKSYAPDTPEAMDLAKRWMAQVEKATGGDRALNEKVREVAREMTREPGFEQHSRASDVMGDYIAAAYGAAIAAGLMPDPRG